MPSPVSQTSIDEPPVPAPHADEHAAGGRVLDGVRDEVLQKPAQQAAVGADRRARSRRRRASGRFSRGDGLELALQLAEELLDAEVRPLRLHGARVEAGDVEEGGEDLLDRVERGVDVLGERRVAGVPVALDERGRIEARRVERLQDVVARGGEEAGLRDVGLVGLGLGAREGLVEPGQLLGALADAPLQGLVRPLARFLLAATASVTSV